MDTVEGKRFIAEFMKLEKSGYTLVIEGKTMKDAHYEQGYILNGVKYPVSMLPYNTLWGYLMTVVEKIYDLDIPSNVTCDLKYSLLSGKIDRAYPDVIDIVKWYNKNK